MCVFFLNAIIVHILIDSLFSEYHWNNEIIDRFILTKCLQSAYIQQYPIMSFDKYWIGSHFDLIDWT